VGILIESFWVDRGAEDVYLNGGMVVELEPDGVTGVGLIPLVPALS
jgi:hypothetical protein